MFIILLPSNSNSYPDAPLTEFHVNDIELVADTNLVNSGAVGTVNWLIAVLYSLSVDVFLAFILYIYLVFVFTLV